jgi:uncharacterized metal-binding protein YceD (DUF177 family)
MIAPLPKQLLSRPFVVTALPDSGLRTTLDADETERDALAKAYGLIAVKSLKAEFLVKPHKGAVHVTGSVHGIVTQTCTVSLDPFDADVIEQVDLVFMQQAGIDAWIAKNKAKQKEEPTLEDEDPPDAIVDGRIDLGEVAAEFLALGIDPYPRKPGVEFDAGPTSDKDPSPFAALAQLKKDK